MSPADLEWDEQRQHYRHKRTGKVVSDAELTALRNALADAYENRLVQLVASYVGGEIAKVSWEDRFLTLIVEAASHGYVLGRGGLGMMTDADWDELAVVVQRQTTYGQRFLNDLQEAIAAKRGTTPLQAIKESLEARTQARAALYGGAAVEGYERGQAAAKSGGGSTRGALPCYPADGGTECGSRCRCRWKIVGDDERRMWVATWITEGDDSTCAGCQERGRRYQRVEYPMAPR